jgi:hypothetical protein
MRARPAIGGDGYSGFDKVARVGCKLPHFNAGAVPEYLLRVGKAFSGNLQFNFGSALRSERRRAANHW